MPQTTPLRYKISSWRQLPKCRSNNDPCLRIHVSDMYNNTELRGFRIELTHPRFGMLFACILEARGTMITEGQEYGVSELSKESILAELEKFGFLIEYTSDLHLPGTQLSYLLTLQGLGYDKIRIINVSNSSDVGSWKPKVVAFRSADLSDWLYTTYDPTPEEYINALDKGTACNLTEISKTRMFRWDWLKYFVGNIDDIISDNANQMIEFDDPNESTESGG